MHIINAVHAAHRLDNSNLRTHPPNRLLLITRSQAILIPRFLLSAFQYFSFSPFVLWSAVRRPFSAFCFQPFSISAFQLFPRPPRSKFSVGCSMFDVPASPVTRRAYPE